MLETYLEIENFLENHTSYILNLEIFNQNTKVALTNLDKDVINKNDIFHLENFLDFLIKNNDFFQLTDEKLNLISKKIKTAQI